MYGIVKCYGKKHILAIIVNSVTRAIKRKCMGGYLIYTTLMYSFEYEESVPLAFRKH